MQHKLDAITVMFPMAGRGMRFGGRDFKPFLHIGDQTFIEAAVQPFRAWSGRIEKFVFVFLQEQEDQFQVTAKLERMFAGLAIETVVLDTPTSGPAQTVLRGIQRSGTAGQIIVCDCDHSIDVAPLFEAVQRSATWDCLVPIWPLSGEAVTAWSTVAVDLHGQVLAIAEKQFPRIGEEFRGVIGCYTFRSARELSTVIEDHDTQNVSEAIAEFLEMNRRVMTCAISSARFFGDPARLRSALESPSAEAKATHD